MAGLRMKQKPNTKYMRVVEMGNDFENYKKGMDDWVKEINSRLNDVDHLKGVNIQLVEVIKQQTIAIDKLNEDIQGIKAAQILLINKLNIHDRELSRSRIIG